MKWRHALGTALMALALVPSGCGKEENTAPTAPPGAPAGSIAPAMNSASSAAITTAELDRVSKAGKPYKLALIVKTRNNPFFDPMIRAAEAEAKSMGASLDVQSPAQESDKERQFALVQDVTAKGAQAILITPADSKGIIPALKQAQDKGILVINLDNRVDKPTAGAAGLTLGGYVGADNQAGGRLAGETMVKALGTARHERRGGKVAVLEGIRGADNAEARKRGFEIGVQD